MNTETTIIAIFGSVGFWTLLGKIYDNWNEERKGKLTGEEKLLFKRALVALLHDRLYQGCTYYLKRGDITVEEFENITELFIPYEKLGGNGTCKKLYDKVKDIL